MQEGKMIVNVVERCACNQGLVSVLDCIPSHFHSSKFASSALKPQFIFAKLIFIKVMLGQRLIYNILGVMFNIIGFAEVRY